MPPLFGEPPSIKTNEPALLAPSATPPQESDAGAADATIAPPVAALVDHLAYTLTVGQARDQFAVRNRKVPAERTLQNYCIEGLVAAQKIRTTYGSEWLINEQSLSDWIERQPIVTVATPAAPATHDVATPHNSAPATAAISDAGGASASHATQPAPQAAGERRTLAEVLIENARLLAQIEGKEQVIRGKEETIAELKDDRAFLRDEVRESRQQRKDVKDIASRMLEAMETIAVAGRLPPSSPQSQSETVVARVIEPDREAEQR